MNTCQPSKEKVENIHSLNTENFDTFKIFKHYKGSLTNVYVGGIIQKEDNTMKSLK